MPNWNDVLREINAHQQNYTIQANSSLDTVRRHYLKRLSENTGRNVIAYYSGWLSKPGLLQTSLLDEDKNGFMSAINGLDRAKGLDLILHTPGGNIAATQSLVHYLHQMFGENIRAIIPQLAMSAGTMIACSCSSILMGKESNLGPVDPQLGGIPAVGVVKEFDRAYKEIKKDPVKQAVWNPILQKYHPTFLLQCENAISWSKKFVTNELESVMFKGVAGKQAKVRKIVKNLTDYTAGHDRHIHIQECEDMGLKIERLEDHQELQDLVLTVHHCFMHTFMNTNAYKITENHDGVAMVKSQATLNPT